MKQGGSSDRQRRSVVSSRSRSSNSTQTRRIIGKYPIQTARRVFRMVRAIGWDDGAAGSTLEADMRTEREPSMRKLLKALISGSILKRID